MVIFLQLLGDLRFLENLKDFDKDNISPPLIKKIREKYVSSPTFDPALIKNISSACEGLCRWVRAIEVYDRVAKVSSLHSNQGAIFLVESSPFR